MILSTKRVQMMTVEGTCAKCSSTEVQAKDADTQELLCLDHINIEDLDPEWLGNAHYVANIPVSRMAWFPEFTSFSDLATRRVTGEERGATGVWVSAAVSEGLRLRTVDVVRAVEERIQSDALYGLESSLVQSLDKFYYLQAIRHGEYAYINLKFQEISGGNLLAVVPWQSLIDFFGSTR